MDMFCLKTYLSETFGVSLPGRVKKYTLNEKIEVKYRAKYFHREYDIKFCLAVLNKECLAKPNAQLDAF